MSDLGYLTERLLEKFNLTGSGIAATGIPSVKFARSDEPLPRSPLLYSSGICFLLTGRKTVYIGPRAFTYDDSNYLALGLPLALECEIDASPESPIYSLFVAVDPVLLRSIAGAMGLEIGREREDVAVRAAPLADEMRDSVRRLMRILASDTDTAVLGETMVREIVYRAIQGPAGAALRGLLALDGQTSRIAQVMDALNTRFADRISVDEMAELAGMSASVFHRAFRQVADDTPLQYLKKVRLTRASTLIAHEDCRVGVAAAAVGYESAAQFSRDFKSHFGVPPADARKLGYTFIRDELRG